MLKSKSILTILSIVFIVSVLLITIGCSPAQAETVSENGDTESTETAESSEEVSEVSDSQPEPETAEVEEAVVESEPQGYSPDKTSIQLESTNGAYVDAGEISWDELGTQVGEINYFVGRTTAFIYIATYDVQEDDIYNATVPEGEAILYFVAGIQKEGDEIPFETGTYDLTKFQGDVPKTAEMGIKLSGGVTVQLDKFKTTVSEFEITNITDTEISGKFNIEENWTTTSGEFKVVLK